jgi:hypothetical protein
LTHLTRRLLPTRLKATRRVNDRLSCVQEDRAAAPLPPSGCRHLGLDADRMPARAICVPQLSMWLP